jgi:hypothetical protein
VADHAYIPTELNPSRNSRTNCWLLIGTRSSSVTHWLPFGGNHQLSQQRESQICGITTFRPTTWFFFDTPSIRLQGFGTMLLESLIL